MVDLRERFGNLVALHRKAHRLTQQELAEQAGVSVDMISKIETGATGARFALIERLATVLKIDPGELFTIEGSKEVLNREPLNGLVTRLAVLGDADLEWISGVVDAVLRRR
ncbi:helix-turn-helix domain-containing protein [Mesorhizobium sp. IMUNJ 23232]|uniref:helix-turn-helix domain-containing protein n=1 Tax=Mesorhizobium sp. IMUNJ 23232 TaxID=3376064 RepID=UPI0037955890